MDLGVDRAVLGPDGVDVHVQLGLVDVEADEPVVVAVAGGVGLAFFDGLDFDRPGVDATDAQLMDEGVYLDGEFFVVGRLALRAQRR